MLLMQKCRCWQINLCFWQIFIWHDVIRAILWSMCFEQWYLATFDSLYMAFYEDASVNSVTLAFSIYQSVCWQQTHTYTQRPNSLHVSSLSMWKINLNIIIAFINEITAVVPSSYLERIHCIALLLTSQRFSSAQHNNKHECSLQSNTHSFCLVHWDAAIDLYRVD